MKRIIYIAFALFAFGMTSCNKQDIRPNGNGVAQEPVWRSSSDDDGGEGQEGDGTGATSDGGTDDGGIVDPNTDPDGDK